ncbi:PREDICTED: pancreatic lipase-related protein 2-like, partial [Myotis davidii]|uniref:pancreatic lipase-related protein 2-like n=1 Tax=Myotis davidii TaxID=225400 RepID=UPI0007672A19
MLPSWIVGLLLLATVRGEGAVPPPWGGRDRHWFGKANVPIHLFHFNQRISSTDLDTVRASNFHLDRKTRFIIHGFISKGEERWLTDMCQGFQEPGLSSRDLSPSPSESQGVPILAWGPCHSILPQTKMGYSLENVHIIGHSLGAHAAGEVGRRLGGSVGRITVRQEDSRSGRKESDALCGHDLALEPLPSLLTTASDVSGFGMSQKVGHLDFYPNGGEQMPGCGKTILSSIVDKNDFWE